MSLFGGMFDLWQDEPFHLDDQSRFSPRQAAFQRGVWEAERPFRWTRLYDPAVLLIDGPSLRDRWAKEYRP